MFIRHLPKSAIFSASHLPQLWRNVIVLVFIALCFGTSQKTHTNWRSQCVRSRMYQWNVDIRYMYWWLIKNLRWAVSTGFIAVIAISWTETDTRNMRSKRIKKYAWVVANVNILPRSMKNSKIVRCYQADAAPICFFSLVWICYRPTLIDGFHDLQIMRWETMIIEHGKMVEFVIVHNWRSSFNGAIALINLINFN